VFLAVELWCFCENRDNQNDGRITYRMRIEKASNKGLSWDENRHSLAKHITVDDQKGSRDDNALWFEGVDSSKGTTKRRQANACCKLVLHCKTMMPGKCFEANGISSLKCPNLMLTEQIELRLHKIRAGVARILEHLIDNLPICSARKMYSHSVLHTSFVRHSLAVFWRVLT
jgi:hypothetical protein